MLLQQGTDTSPVQHWTQGAARLAQALVGGNIMRAEREADQQNAEKIGQFLMAGQGGAPVAASPSITSEPLPPAATSPPASSRVYSENEFNPLDAAVATPKELAVGVPAPAQYAPTIGKAAIDNDLPPALLASQIKQESGFNPNAVSPAGAQGISQFMPGTAAEMGINPLDPNQAIPAGARYLRQQIDKFGGSIPHGLAAYNGGPGRLERAGGDISRMPAETRQYVQNVQQMAGGDPAALPPNATPTQGYAIPGQPSPQALAAGLQNPNAGNPNRLAIAAQLLSDPRTPPHMRALIAQQMKPRDQWITERGTDGSIYQRNSLTNELKAIEKSDVLPQAAVDQKIAIAAAGRPQTTIDQRAESKFDEELGKGQAKRWNGYIESGQAAQKKMVDINAMRDISKRLGTQGAMANAKEVFGPYADALGINVDGLSDIQAYSSIVQRLAPQQRAEGSGSTSDIEFKGFLKSLPTLTQNPQAREMTLNTMEALTRDEIARGEIASQLASKEITRVEAEKQLKALPDPMQGFAEWRKANPGLYGEAIKPQPKQQSVDDLLKKYGR